MKTTFSDDYRRRPEMTKNNFNVNTTQMIYDGSNVEIKDIYVKKSANGNVVIDGSLMVKGDTFTINSEQMRISDPNIELGTVSSAMI